MRIIMLKALWHELFAKLFKTVLPQNLETLQIVAEGNILILILNIQILDFYDS